jgi:hypothetical protein
VRKGISVAAINLAAAHVAGVAALWAEKLKMERQNKSLLSARLLASASTDGLKPGFDRSDIGHGVVRAPQA